MGIILTMPDQMTPVIESSVVMAQVFCSSRAMPVSAAAQSVADFRHCLKTRFIRGVNRFYSEP